MPEVRFDQPTLEPQAGQRGGANAPVEPPQPFEPEPEIPKVEWLDSLKDRVKAIPRIAGNRAARFGQRVRQTSSTVKEEVAEVAQELKTEASEAKQAAKRGMIVVGRRMKAGATEAADLPTRALTSERLKKYFWYSLLVLAGATVVRGAAEILWAKKRAEETGRKTEIGKARTPEEAYTAETNNTQIDYSLQGFNGLLRIEHLTDPQHGNDGSVVVLAARAGGPAGLIDTYEVKFNPEKKRYEVVFDDETNQPVPAISEQVFNDISAQLNLDQAGKTELRQMWGQYLANPEGFDQSALLNFLQTNGADPQVIAFYRLAMDLKAKNPDAPWQERFDPLNNWEPKPEVEATPQSNQEQEFDTGWDWVEPVAAMAENLGIESESFLGPAATLRAEWRHDSEPISRQLKVVEMAAQTMPEQKMALYAGFASTDADWVISCVMVGLMAVSLNKNPAAVLVDAAGKSIAAAAENLSALQQKLAEIGQGIMVNLAETSAEFQGWVEEQRREINSRKLVSRLKNGLSLSRNSENNLEIILIDAANQDLKDLVLTEGPNWFKHVPKDHPELPQILRFFDCRNFEELQALAGQPDRVVNRLYKVMVGSGKKAVLRKTEEVTNLIDLYKQASGFSGSESR